MKKEFAWLGIELWIFFAFLIYFLTLLLSDIRSLHDIFLKYWHFKGSSSSIAVKQSTHNPKFEGSNLAAGNTGKRKLQREKGLPARNRTHINFAFLFIFSHFC
jgi:hypothetical protein